MKSERGYVLVLGLLLLLLTTLIGIALVHTSSFGVMIAGNGLESQKAFWIAESGIQDARDKLSGVESVAKFKEISGLTDPVSYAGGKYVLAVSDDPLSPRRVIVRSTGTRNQGDQQVASRTVESVIQKFTFGLPGALYSKSMVTVNGAQTFINGNDGCGGTDKPAIITTQPSIDFKNGDLGGNGIAHVTTFDRVPLVTDMGSSLDYPLQQYVNAYKDYATTTPAEITDQNIQGSTLGNAWGAGEIIITPAKDGYPQPIQLSASAGEPNVIYLNPPVNQNGTKEVGLQNVSGHGLLLIDGTANISGGFNWYGLIIATGGLKFTGVGGADKNITGAVMAGETGVKIEVDVMGSVAILYCSGVTNYLRDLSTAIMISWREIKG